MLQRMLNNARKARANDEGFTLIELLIVIVILGVLAGIVVFSVSTINDRGTLAACKTDRKNVEVAVETYYAQKGSYPSGIADKTPTDPTTLVGAGILREAPSSTDYTFNLAAGGVLTVTTGPAGC